jgi:ABC-type glycerol-3-phosphate transport system substrate-binding protein
VVDHLGMSTRHLATAALGLSLLLAACGSDSSGSKASSGTSTPDAVAVTTAVMSAPPSGPAPTVRTDDLDAQLSAVDRELSGTEQSVNQANDTSPDRADD